MTVADIIAAARKYTSITGSSWFDSADELRSLNRAYRDVYEKILDQNDEYFILEVTVPTSSLVAVRDHLYEYTLPAGWYRLRSIYGIVSDGEIVLDRIDPKDTRRGAGYRYYNGKLRLYYAEPFTDFRIEYYPAPAEYTLTTETIVYPPQLEPLILAYQMAIDIINQQNGDTSRYEAEYSKLWGRFSSAIGKRDDYSYPRVANVYRSTYPGW